MSNILKVMGIDPSLRNTGMCLAHVDMLSGKIAWQAIAMVQTKAADKAKVQRQNSADLVSARELYRGLHRQFSEWQPNIITGEVPAGAQDARAALSFGMSIMLLASVPVPIIEVVPREVKAATGMKNATKAEMIEWAHSQAPHLGWHLQDRNGKTWKKGDLCADNEHMADAMASVAACVETVQFAQLMAVVGRSAA